LHGMQEVVGSTPISSTSFSTQNLLISRGFVVCGGGGGGCETTSNPER